MELVERWHNWLIPASRYLYGFRILLPITFGMIGTPPLRFLLLNVASAISRNSSIQAGQNLVTNSSTWPMESKVAACNDGTSVG